jgi:hypothetical protein
MVKKGLLSAKDRLHKSFESYVDYAIPYLKKKVPILKEEIGAKMSIAFINPAYLLRDIVENLECSRKFNNLVSNCSEVYGGEPIKKLEKGSIISNIVISPPRQAMQNFFRRSKLYLKIFEGIPIGVNEYFEQLLVAFDEKQVKKIKLGLIEKAIFQESIIDFGIFRIQNFAKEELDSLVDNQLNRIFYPYAEVDTNTLSDYSFIVEENYEKRGKINFGYTGDFLGEDPFLVSREFPGRTIQLLALFDWESILSNNSNDVEKTWWEAFSIPFSLCITDDILESPPFAPNISGLEIYPIHYGEKSKKFEKFPLFSIGIDRDKSGSLKKIITNTQMFLDDIDLKKCSWEFLERAMG